jgi:hypothetical protein
MPTTDQLEYVRGAIGIALLLANVGVWYGVYLERDSAPKEIQDRGWRILVRSLATEAALGFFLFAVDTTIGLRQTAVLASAGIQIEESKAKIAIANDHAATAMADAALLGVSQKDLHVFVVRKQGEIGRQFDQFKSFAEGERKRAEKVIADLDKNRKSLEDVRKQAEASLQSGKKILADMQTTLAQERAERDKFARLAEPRQIDDVHFAALIEAIKPFPNTPVDLAITRDPEAGDLMVRISDALVAAKWDVRPWSGGGFGLTANARPKLPTVGEVTAWDVQITFSDSDHEQFNKPVLTLWSALSVAGIKTSAAAIRDKIDGKPNPQAVKAGLIHLTVGKKQ